MLVANHRQTTAKKMYIFIKRLHNRNTTIFFSCEPINFSREKPTCNFRPMNHVLSDLTVAISMTYVVIIVFQKIMLSLSLSPSLFLCLSDQPMHFIICHYHPTEERKTWTEFDLSIKETFFNRNGKRMLEPVLLS